jgi:hypothetical protein
MAKHTTSRFPRYVVCVERGTYRIDLDVGKIYREIRPLKNDTPKMVRIIDGSGEDYLYPSDWFVSIELPAKAKKALVAAGSGD